MITIKRYMYPSYYTMGNDIYISFYTANGRKHNIRLKRNDKLQCYTFRFHGNTWKALKYYNILYQND